MYRNNLGTEKHIFLNEILERIRKHNQERELIEREEVVKYLNKLKSLTFNLRDKSRAEKCKHFLTRILKTYNDFEKCLSTGYLAGYGGTLIYSASEDKKFFKKSPLRNMDDTASIIIASELLTDNNFITISSESQHIHESSSDMFGQKMDVSIPTIPSYSDNESIINKKIIDKGMSNEDTEIQSKLAINCKNSDILPAQNENIEDSMLTVEINKTSNISGYSRDFDVAAGHQNDIKANKRYDRETITHKDTLNFHIEDLPIVFTSENASQTSGRSEVFTPNIETRNFYQEMIDNNQTNVESETLFTFIKQNENESGESQITDEPLLLFTDQSQNGIVVEYNVIDQIQETFDENKIIDETPLLFDEQNQNETTKYNATGQIQIKPNENKTLDETPLMFTGEYQSDNTEYNKIIAPHSPLSFKNHNQQKTSEDQASASYEGYLMFGDRNVSEKMDTEQGAIGGCLSDDSDLDTVNENLTKEQLDEKFEKCAKKVRECWTNVREAILEVAVKYKEKEDKKKEARKLVKNSSFMSDNSSRGGDVQNVLDDIKVEFEQEKEQSDGEIDDFFLLDWRKMKIE